MTTPDEQQNPPEPSPTGPQPATPQPGYSQPGYPPPPYATPPTGANPPYPQPPSPPTAYGPPPGTEKNWMGVTALVLSLAGLFTGITAIGGIVFGHLSLSAAKRGEADNRGMGVAGLVIGYIIVVLGIIALIALFAIAGWFVSECAGDNPPEWCDVTIESS
ncbi:DUF4190 domain-containing protein [Demequina iriomotensis]|uniref:DUF4190 domain-containing protein n=1 Tax=Demequina iriomotensis TaxID=1536641 RepID=UPI000780A899|nr:DUF4190 domain-containing protein [Demequina iriomotensis]